MAANRSRHRARAVQERSAGGLYPPRWQVSDHALSDGMTREAHAAAHGNARAGPTLDTARRHRESGFRNSGVGSTACDDSETTCVVHPVRPGVLRGTHRTDQGSMTFQPLLERPCALRPPDRNRGIGANKDRACGRHGHPFPRCWPDVWGRRGVSRPGNRRSVTARRIGQPCAF